MALYLGNHKVQIILDGKKYNLILCPSTITVNNILLSIDNYILQDCNGLYINPKEGE